MYLNPEAESRTRTRRESQGGEVALKKSSTQSRWDESALKKSALKTGEFPGNEVALKKSCTKDRPGGGGSVALKKSGTKTRPGTERSRVALKKVALKTWAETGGDPLALKNFGTKNLPEREGIRERKPFGTQKNWHSISMATTVQIEAGQFALKNFRTKGTEEKWGNGGFLTQFFSHSTEKWKKLEIDRLNQIEDGCRGIPERIRHG